MTRRTILRMLSATCLVLSFATGAGLVIWDVAHGFSPLTLHSPGMAVSLMLIGTSYALAHMAGAVRTAERIRAISLGAAFVLWGAEQFIPTGRVTMASDCVLIAVFVVDLSLAVKKRLSRGET